MRVCLLVFGMCATVCATVLFTPSSLVAQNPYVAFGGAVGGVEDCDACDAILGFELGVGLQIPYLRGELFYFFDSFEAEGFVVRGGQKISFDSDVLRHVVGAAGVARFPIINIPPHETTLRFAGVFLGGGMGYAWEESESYIKETQRTVTTDLSSLMVIGTVGSDLTVSFWGNDTVTLEVGYRYHRAIKKKRDGLRPHHLVVVRLRYGF